MIPKKLYYSISEVCTFTGLEPHVLRYWESEFPQLRPKKNRAGNRAYREKDIEVINYIKHLLYEEKFTIPGAKKKLSEGKIPSEIEETAAPAPDQSQDESVKFSSVDEIKKTLQEILQMLKS